MQEIASLMLKQSGGETKVPKVLISYQSSLSKKKEEDIFYDHALVKNSNHRSLG